ncbi:MAG TPA: HI0074 family nucleotidyltransferase substrate-binding subunit [Rubrivivax sp.]|nr:HI0074 family nucleotidyltransferase substrate-binding subunit [Rubrivivax sp.]HPO18016.1 HI0074 family nucleotidyltransferase substrate-binding subunit [Rubrivivax sp.]
MADDRFQLALGRFSSALARLHEVLDLSETTIVRDALIQRFEFTFEAGWRAAYRWLRARGADVAEEAFAVLPRAFANKLISDEAGWSEMRRKRNLTSHTYQEQLAIEVAAFVRGTGVRLLDALLATLRARADE